MKRLFSATLIAAIALGGAGLMASQTREETSAPTAEADAVGATAATHGGSLAADGLAFAQRNCSACHAVTSPGLSPNPEAPTFADIANREGLTAETLATWLQDAHNYPEAMQFDLGAADADRLAAYMLTLRSEDYKPPIG